MQHTLKDDKVNIKKISLYYDSTSVIVITRNLVLHTWTKHIEGKYHFIREYVQDGRVDIQYVSTEQLLGNLLTKSLGFDQLSIIHFELGLVPNPLSEHFYFQNLILFIEVLVVSIFWLFSFGIPISV